MAESGFSGRSVFQGTIGRTHEESTPWWEEPVGAKPGSPNVIYVMLDDVGFADLGEGVQNFV